MNKYWLGVLALFSALSQAAEPINDKDRFEAEYVACMQSGFADKCWTKLLSGHAVPWVDNEGKILQDAEAAYVSWLQGQGIYKVHPGLKEVKGEVFDNRSYLLERDDGAVAAVWISFRQAQGKWYIHEVMASSADEFVRTAVGMTRPREK